MNQLAKNQLRKKLAADALTIDALEDFDELTEINRLAEQVNNPAAKAQARKLLSPPAKVGNVTLYPITLGAYMWHEEVIKAHFSEDPVMMVMATGYMLSIARSPRILNDLCDKADVTRAVKRWGRSCGATFDELSGAIEKLCGDAPDDDRDVLISKIEKIIDEPLEGYDVAFESVVSAVEEYRQAAQIDYGPLFSMLISEYNQPLEYWMWEAPISSIDLCAQAYMEQIRNEIKKQDAATGNQSAPNVNDPNVIATHNFMKAARVFVARLKRRNEIEKAAV